jgi:hypothetical protein
MLPIQKTCVFSVLCLCWVSASAVCQTPPDKPAAPAPAQPAQPAAPTDADKLLDEAVTRMGKLGAYDVRMQHHLRNEGVRVRSSARLVVAPGSRLYYESQIEMGDAKGVTKSICDGKTIWRLRLSGEEKALSHYELEKLQAAIAKMREDPGDLDAAKVQVIADNIAAEHGFNGIRPMLVELQKRLTFTKHEAATLRRADKPDAAVHLLEGQWNKAMLEKLIPPKRGDDPKAVDPMKLWEERKLLVGIARTCKLYLARDGKEPSADSLWPLRIEWWGPVDVAGSDQLLTAIDFDLSLAAVPESTFQPTAEEREIKLQEFDPKFLVAQHRERALMQQQALENRTRGALSPLSTAPLSPTTPAKKP